MNRLRPGVSGEFEGRPSLVDVITDRIVGLIAADPEATAMDLATARQEVPPDSLDQDEEMDRRVDVWSSIYLLGLVAQREWSARHPEIGLSGLPPEVMNGMHESSMYPLDKLWQRFILFDHTTVWLDDGSEFEVTRSTFSDPELIQEYILWKLPEGERHASEAIHLANDDLLLDTVRLLKPEEAVDVLPLFNGQLSDIEANRILALVMMAHWNESDEPEIMVLLEQIRERHMTHQASRRLEVEFGTDEMTPGDLAELLDRLSDLPPKDTRI